jgi:hypothetical protein
MENSVAKKTNHGSSAVNLKGPFVPLFFKHFFSGSVASCKAAGVVLQWFTRIVTVLNTTASGFCVGSGSRPDVQVYEC